MINDLALRTFSMVKGRIDITEYDLIRTLESHICMKMSVCKRVIRAQIKISCEQYRLANEIKCHHKSLVKFSSLYIKQMCTVMQDNIFCKHFFVNNSGQLLYY